MRILAKVSCLICLPFGLTAAQSPATAGSSEDNAVYGAVFDALYGSSSERPTMIVVADSLYPRNAGIAYQGRLLVSHSSQIDPHAVDEFDRATGGFGFPPQSISYSVPVRVLRVGDRSVLATLGNTVPIDTTNGTRRESPFWLGFVKKFPGAWGLTVLSGIGYNRLHDQALTFVRHLCGACESAETFVLAKEGGKWRVVERIPSFSQDGIGIGSLRYVGPEARRLALKLKQEDSIRRAMRDSATLARAPRRLSGRVTDRKTGLPVRFAQIFLGNAQSYPRHWGRFVADSMGAFVIPNPPVGGNHLEIECAGNSYEPARTLDMRAVYMAPGAVAFVDSYPVDIAPCWRKRRLHELSLGWFESAAARASPLPNDEEALVLTAVLDHMRRALPHRRLLWSYNTTVHICKWHPQCGEVAIPALLAAGVIDTSVFADFRKKGAMSMQINPAFFMTSGLRVVSDETIAYYADEWLLERNGRRDKEYTANAFWSAFHKLHGGNTAVLGITRPGFNSDENQAIIEVRVDSMAPHWYGRSRMMLLRKEQGAWKISIPDVGTLKRSARWSGDRCVPTIVERESVTAKAVNDLLGDFLVTLVPATGMNGSRKTRMRFSRKPRDPMVFMNRDGKSRSAQHPDSARPGHPPLVFEIIDEKTGLPDDEAALSFFLDGAGREIPRRTSILRLDGFSHSLEIIDLDASGFSGTYSAGVYGPSEFGVFCAERAATPRGN